MVSFSPADPRFRTNLAQAAQCLNQGDAVRAKALLAPLRKAAPKEPLIHYLLGGVAKLEGNLAAAEKAFRKSLSLNPSQPQVEKSLGIVLRDLGRMNDAIAAFKRAAALEPGSVEAQHNLGLTALQANDLDTADNAFNAMLAMAPAAPQALAGKARIDEARGNHEGAIKGFQAALSHDPRYWRALLGQASNLLALGRNEEAAACLKDAMRLEPRAAETHQLSGRAAFALGDSDAALGHFRKAVELAPGQIGAHRDLNQLLYMLGRKEEFLSSYRSLLQQAPTHGPLLCGLSDLALSTDQPEAALPFLQKAVDAGLRDPAVLDAFGLALAACGHIQEALSAHKNAVKQQPRQKVLLQNYTRALLTAHEFEMARDIAGRAVAVDPLDQMSRAYYVTALQTCGDPSAEGLFDAERFVDARQIETPDGFASLAEFNAALLEDLLRLHKMNAEPFDQSLRGGTQLELSRMANAPETIRLLKTALTQNVNAFAHGLPQDPDHPFLRYQGEDFHFSGIWSVRLRCQGHHITHVHPQGWISSAYYVKLPRQTPHDPDKRGWFHFGRPPLPGLDDVTPNHFVEPKEGTLVLFPSYYWHGTMPFDEETMRVTVAFDAVPEGGLRSR